MEHYQMIFYVVTGNKTWGRHTELAKAFKAAKIKIGEQRIEYKVTCFLLPMDLPADVVKNIMNSYYVNDFGGINRCDGLSPLRLEQCSKIAGFSYFGNTNEVVAWNERSKKRLAKQNSKP